MFQSDTAVWQHPRLRLSAGNHGRVQAGFASRAGACPGKCGRKRLYKADRGKAGITMRTSPSATGLPACSALWHRSRATAVYPPLVQQTVLRRRWLRQTLCKRLLLVSATTVKGSLFAEMRRKSRLRRRLEGESCTDCSCGGRGSGCA